MRGIKITFKDGTTEEIRDATNTRVEDDILHVEVRRDSFGFASWYEHRGSYPIINIKSYHWLESR